MNTLLSYCKPLFFLLLVLAGYFAQFVPQAVVPDNSLRIWFYDEDPNLKSYYETMEVFGNDEIVAIFLRFQSAELSNDALALVRELSQKLESNQHIDRVFSLSTGKNIVAEQGRLVVGDMVPDRALSLEERIALKQKLLTDPLIGRVYMSPHSSGVLIIAQIVARKDFDSMRDAINKEIYASVEQVTQKSGIPTSYGGMGVMYTGLNELTDKDIATTGTLSYVAMFVLIAVLLRSVLAVVIALVVVVITTMITLGIFGYLGNQLNLLTMILPTLLVILSIADCVHVLAHYRGARQEATKKRAMLARSLGYIAVPCLFTTLTTAFGFGSLYTAQMQVIHDLGTYAALGVVVAYIVTFVTVPVFLSFFELNPIGVKVRMTDRLIRRFTDLCGYLATQHTNKVILTFLVLMAGMVGTFSRISVDLHPFDYFPDDAKVARDHAIILDEFGPYFPLEFTVKTERQDGIKNPQLLKKMLAFQQQHEQHPHIGSSISVAKIVHRLHTTLAPDAQGLPQSQEVVERELSLYALEDRAGLKPYLNEAADFAHIIFKIRFVSGKETKALLDSMVASGKTHFSGLAEFGAAGYMPLYLKTMEYALDTQTRGFSLAFLVIFVFILLLFRNIRFTVLAVLPNLFPVCVVGTTIAFTAMDLDFGTASIASILLGIAVDDTIHFVFRLRQEQKKYPEHMAMAIKVAISEVGHALVTTSLILGVGFSILMYASMNTVVYFGTLLVLAVFAALIADLVFLPALVYRFERRGKAPNGPSLSKC